MAEQIKEVKDIKSLCALLTEENKRYVIAVGNALLFTQKTEKKNPSCRSSASRVT